MSDYRYHKLNGNSSLARCSLLLIFSSPRDPGWGQLFKESDPDDSSYKRQEGVTAKKAILLMRNPFLAYLAW